MDQSPFPSLDITTTVSGLLCWRDFHPLEWQLASLHWRGRAQRLLCWAAAGEALRKAQGACDAHISEDAGNYRHDRDRPR